MEARRGSGCEIVAAGLAGPRKPRQGRHDAGRAALAGVGGVQRLRPPPGVRSPRSGMTYATFASGAAAALKPSGWKWPLGRALDPEAARRPPPGPSKGPTGRAWPVQPSLAESASPRASSADAIQRAGALDAS
ncbi:hypothetical protein BDY21DRAFT_360729 [Lineolata rhizophorae]|uniref:Uncharacterized protein n=1 Tax=Lineolata rhizophorae TaxID=578093 RepID=A0A6A6PE02_9PEZI|nr:hypothetical protein BDY21DRAFT_360729 [Lineolata rhizophorae]